MSKRSPRPLALAALFVSACLVSACGQLGASSSSPGAVSAPETVPGCPNFVTVVETSPAPTDFSESSPVFREQERLAGDMDKVAAYGEAHRADFGSVRLESGRLVRLVVAFRDHISDHCAALRAMLEFPDEFEITRSVHTEAELRRIQDEIAAMAAGNMYSVGVVGDVVEVALTANAEAVAAQLVGRYGDAAQITVGRFTYPDRLPDDHSLPCASEAPEADLPGVRATVHLSSDMVSAGADFSGSVTLVNEGHAAVHVETGSPLSAVVFGADGVHPVSTYIGGIAGVGLTLDMPPGASRDIEILGGTASCDPAIGYALAPGTYIVRVPVEVYTMHANTSPDISYLWSEPASLTVVAGR